MGQSPVKDPHSAAARAGLAPASSRDTKLRILIVDPRLATAGYLFSLADALERLTEIEPDLAWSPPARRSYHTGPALALFPRLIPVTDRIRLQGRMVNALCRLSYERQLSRVLDFAISRRHRAVHFNWSFRPKLELDLVRELRSRRIPVVYTAHNPAPHDTSSASEALVAFCRAVDQIVVLTEYVKGRVLETTGLAPERVTVIPHGDFSAEIMPPASESAGTTPFAGHRKVACLGAIRPYKGVPDLLKAWPRVLEACPDARLIIAGTLRWAARAEVREALRRLGPIRRSVHTEFEYLSGEKYSRHLQSATVLVQPYRSASQSGNTVHAYGKGIPVVCTRVGGLAEAIDEGRTGSVAEPGDPDALAEAIVRILQLNRSGELARDCRALHRERYSWQGIAAAHQDLYRSLTHTGAA